MNECPFCDNNIKESVFAISDHFMAVYNIAPVLPGHSLIIPKKHIKSILDLTDPELMEMSLFARKVTRLLLKAFNAGAFNWSVQDSEPAGQTVVHLHLHLVPRQINDLADPGDWYPLIADNSDTMLDSLNRPKVSTSQMQQIIGFLRQEARQMGLFTI